MANNKKIKNLIVCSAVGGVVIALAVASIVTGSMRKEKDKQNSVANVSVDRVKLRDDNEQTQVSTAKTEVEIQFEDCAVQTGTQLKLTALVVPENTEQALVWSSSDLSVLEINSEGILTVKGVGTAVVTATVGTVSDSVVVEGIENVADGSKNQFPVYTGGILASGGWTGIDSTSNSDGNTGVGVPGNSGASGSTGTESDTASENGSAGSSGTSGNGSTGSNGTSGDGSTGSGDVSGNGDTGNGTTTSNGGSGDGQGSSSVGGSGDTPQGGSSTGSTGSDIAGELPQIGFTQRYSNVYVCEDGNTYYGEIITQPNVTIIYIKLRSESFDSKIRSVLMQLLPEEYGQVWNNYVSAGTDRTFTAEGRKVRIVAAPNGGHSQIVIYN